MCDFKSVAAATAVAIIAIADIRTTAGAEFAIATGPISFFARLSKVDDDRATINRHSVHSRNGCLSGVCSCHFDKPKAFRATALSVGVVAQMPVAAEVGSGDERDELGSG